MKSRRWMGLFLLCICLGMQTRPSFAKNSPRVAQKNPSYEVSKASGILLFRQSASPKWKPLKKGRKLFEGDLVQVAKGARLQLAKIREEAPADARTKTGLARSTIVVASPTIFRVGPRMMRSLELSQFFVKDMPSKSAAAGQDKSLSYHFDEAWKKLSIVFSGKSDIAGKKGEVDFALLDDSNVSVAITARKLRILAPADKSIFQSMLLPLEVKLTWTEAQEKSPEYKIFVWEPFQTKPETPTASTRETFHTVQLPSYGSFYIQIATADDEWISSTHILHVISPESANGLALNLRDPNQPTLAATKLDAAPVELSFPPEGLQVHTKGKQTPVVFAWTHQQDLMIPKRIGTYSELVIENQKGKKLLHTSVSGTEATILLKPGSYRWYVVDKPHAGQRSETRSLIVSDQGMNEDMMRVLVQPGVSGTYDFVSALSFGG